MKQKLLLLASILLLAFISAPAARAQWVQTNGLYLNGVNGAEAYQVNALAVSGTNLFAGTDGSGVFLSTNNGTSWTTTINGLTGNGGYVRSFAVSGTNLFAGADDGVYRSTDSGTSWTAAGTGLTGGPSYVYALAVIDTNLFAGSGDGVYRSTDNGTSWTLDTNGMGAQIIFALAVIGTNLFVGTDAFPNSGVFLSTNNGKSWRAADTGLPNASSVLALVVSGTNLFAGTGWGVYRSTDNGTSWTLDTMGMRSQNVYALAVKVSTDGRDTNLFAGTGLGVYRSTNNGTNWRATDTGLVVYPNNVSALAVSGTNLFATSGYNGVWRRPLSDFGISDVSQNTPIQNSIQSYPNPFLQSTTISFTSEASGYADVSIVNLLGAEVERVFSGELAAGVHSFVWDASQAAAGTYFSIVRSNNSVIHTPMILAR